MGPELNVRSKYNYIDNYRVEINVKMFCKNTRYLLLRKNFKILSNIAKYITWIINYIVLTIQMNLHVNNNSKMYNEKPTLLKRYFTEKFHLVYVRDRYAKIIQENKDF